MSEFENHEWVLRGASDAHTPMIKAGGTNTFKFIPQPPNASKPFYYTLEFAVGEMSDAWKDIVLYPYTGKDADTLPWSIPKGEAPPQYGAAGREARKLFNKRAPTRVRRLEGDMTMGDTEGTVVVLLLENDVDGPGGRSPLLVAFLRDGNGNPEGAAAGSRR